VTDGTAGVNPPFIASFNSPNGNGRYLDNTKILPPCNPATINPTTGMPIGGPGCFGTGLGVAGVGQDLSNRAPYVLQYNLTIQHELWKDTRFEVGYAGSKTKNWTTNYDANAVAPADRLAFAQLNGSIAGNLLKPFDVLKSSGIGYFRIMAAHSMTRCRQHSPRASSAIPLSSYPTHFPKLSPIPRCISAMEPGIRS